MKSYKAILYLSIFIIGIGAFLVLPGISIGMVEEIDLAIAGISVSPSSPAFNEPVTITITVTNSGAVAITDAVGFNSYNANFRDFTISGSSIPSVSPDSPLEPGKSVKYVFNGWFDTKGEKNVGFEADYNNLLSEYKTTNNYDYIKVNVVEQYDFKIHEISIKPAKPVVNQPVQIAVKVQNNGYAQFRTAAGIESYSYNFEDFEEQSKAVPTVNSSQVVASGEYFYYYFNGKFTSSGDKEFNFAIDINDQIDEKDESNNDKTETHKIYTSASVDLNVKSISLDITEPIVGEQAAITVSVENIGSASLTSDMGLLREKDLTVFPVVDKEVKEIFTDFEITSESNTVYPTFDNSFDPKDVFTYTYIGYFSSPGTKELNFQINTNSRLIEGRFDNDSGSKSVLVYKDAAERDGFNILDYYIEFHSSASARVYLKTDRQTNGQAWRRKQGYTNFYETAISENAEKHYMEMNELLPGTKYEYKIRATRNTVSHDVDGITFMTPLSDDVKIIQGPSISFNGAAANISWKTDKLSDSHVYYKINTADSYKEIKDSDYKTAHELEITGLSLGAAYDYYIKSATKLNKSAKTEALSFGVPAEASTDTGDSTDTSEDSASDSGAGNDTGADADSNNMDLNSAIITNSGMYGRLKGAIILTVEKNGEAYYIHPNKETRYYLGRPDDAFTVMREQGIGITDTNIAKIPLGLSNLTGQDSDGDGLPDLFEDAIGSDKNKSDTDGDGFNDRAEVESGYDPAVSGVMMSYDASFGSGQAGKIFLQIEQNGEAWYINPSDSKRYFLGRPADAFQVMRNLGLGISNSDFSKL